MYKIDFGNGAYLEDKDGKLVVVGREEGWKIVAQIQQNYNSMELSPPPMDVVTHKERSEQ